MRRWHSDPATRLLLRVAATTGVRASELFGIEFANIDMASGAITITRQLQDGVVSTLKTERSVRTVHVPQSVLKELREHPRRFAGGLVFTSPEGGPMQLSNFHRRIWRPLCEKAGITMLDVQGRKVTFHSLRHTAATAAIAAGANIPDVAAMLGHATPNVTLTVYADAWRAKAEHSAEALAGVLFGESVSSLVAEVPEIQIATEAPVSELPVSQGVRLVGRVGIEPTTKRLRGDYGITWA